MVLGGGNIVLTGRSVDSNEELGHDLGAIFVGSIDGIPKLDTQSFKQMRANAAAFVFGVTVGFVNLKYLSVMSTTNRLPYLVLGRDPSRSVLTYLKGSSRGDS